MPLQSLLDSLWSNIVEASKILYQALYKTPLVYSNLLSKATGCNVYLKLENLQVTNAFKARGAYFKIYKSIDIARKAGVIAASTGNHAQGVAYSASVLGVEATIFMPETTPPAKINAVKRYGAKVVLHGEIFDDAYRKAVEVAKETGALFVHPFDDPYIIGGQGTIGIEIAEQLSNVDAVLVAIGGGGLISGIGIALKRLKPGVKVIGVEPANAPKYFESRKAGKIMEIEPKPSIADAVVTKSIGELTYSVMNEVVDDVVIVDEELIAEAIYMLLDKAKVVAEGAGALPLAALLSGRLDLKRKNVVLVISGGNIDPTILHRVIMRGLVHERRTAVVSIALRDVPGELRKAVNILYKYRCNIVDIRHDRFSLRTPVGYALVEIVFEAPEPDVIDKVRKELSEIGYLIE
jgi:threonine dehydratase